MERSAIERLATTTVLVVGDRMIDRFVYGDVDRISSEAPIPVLRFREDASMLGGAGNVARNIVALNGKAVLVGAVGQDPDGDYVSQTLCPDAGIEGRIVQTACWPTVVKTRFVCEGHQMLRVDREETRIDEIAIERSKLAVAHAAPSADAMVLSDYAIEGNSGRALTPRGRKRQAQ
jgi:D-beta-D-heptose 7-phosphate kinase / D-beta-D-heptose 1-phosphate adenosyltransferase